MDPIEEDAAAAEATAAASRERDLRRLARAGALGEIQELIGEDAIRIASHLCAQVAPLTSAS